MTKVTESQFRDLLIKSHAKPDVLRSKIEGNGHELDFDYDKFSKKQQSVYDTKIKSQGFGSRFIESIRGVPERLQRGFGSEQVREGRQEASKGFDLADLPGDLADIIGPALPVVTSIAGGIIGGGAAIPTGPAAIAAGVAGAGAGGVMGETGRRAVGDMLRIEDRFGGEIKTPLEKVTSDIKGIAGEGVKSAAGELVGGQLIARPLAAVGRKLLAPFAKHFADDIARIAARRGVDLPASSVVDSPLVQITEQATGKGIFGGNLRTIVTNAQDYLAKQADEIVKLFGASDDLTLAGKNIEEGLVAYKGAWQKVKNKIYDAAFKIIPKTNRPLTENTKAALGQVLSQKDLAESVLGSSANSPLRNLQKALNERGLKQPSIEALMAASNELNEIIKFGGRDIQSTGSDAALRKIAASLDQDIMAHLKQFAPEAYEAALRADEFYAQGIESLNSALGKTIGSLADEPSKIATRAIRPKSPEQASRVIEMVISTEGGAERVANIQSSFVRRILDDATKNGTKPLQGDALQNMLNKYGDETLDAVLGQDARIALREISQLSKALGTASKIADGSQTAFLLKIQAITAALFTGNIPVAAQIAGGDVILSKLFQSQIGRKWMTEGLTSPTIYQKFGIPAFIGASKISGREISDTVNPITE